MAHPRATLAVVAADLLSLVHVPGRELDVPVVALGVGAHPARLDRAEVLAGIEERVEAGPRR